MKKKVSVALVLFMLLSVFIPFSVARAEIATDNVELSATGAVAIDANTAEVLYDKNMNETAYPASTTKIMTALVILDYLPLDTMIPILPAAVGVEGSSLRLKAGEEMSVEDLLYGLMLKSTNDSALALALGCCETLEDFADLMNSKAAELGAINTHFVTPNGLTDENHYTTPYDLALIMREAVNNETLLKIMSTTEYTIPATNMSEERKVENSNRLLFDETELEMDGETRTYKYDGVVCGKTGFTEASQYCLVEYAQKNDLDIITVTMHSTFEEQFPDAIRLLDSVFDHYEGKRLIKEGAAIDKVYVRNGGKVDVTVDKPVVACLEKNSSASTSDYSWKIKADEDLTAPLPEGSRAGVLVLSRNEDEVAQYPVYTVSEVKVSGFRKLVDSFKNSVLSKLLFVLLLFIVAVVIAGVLMMRPSKKRAARRKKRREDNVDVEEARIARRAAEREVRRTRARERAREADARHAEELEQRVRNEERRKKEEAVRALSGDKKKISADAGERVKNSKSVQGVLDKLNGLRKK